MFEFLKRFIKNRSAHPADTEDTVEEFWQTSFSSVRHARFYQEETDAYKTKINGGVELTLKRQHLFAWTVDPVYRYKDMVLEALIEFPPAPETADTIQDSTASRAGRCAAGFNIRYITETTFYSVLVSDYGMIRMDVIINGNPVPLIGWTALPEQTGAEQQDEQNDAPYLHNNRVFSLRIIARGTRFTLILNDQWVGECEDDTIQAPGTIAFAAQNWGQLDQPAFRLKALALESRPLEVETLHERWNTAIPVNPDARMNLASTLFAMEYHIPALIQIRKLWKQREAGPQDLLLAARICAQRQLESDAESCLRRCLELQNTNSAARAELALLFQMSGRTKDLEELLKETGPDVIAESPVLCTLAAMEAGSAGDYHAAAELYTRAAELEPEQPIHHLNLGRAYMNSGNNEAARPALLGAARICLTSEDYTTMGDVITLLETIAPLDTEVRALAAKHRYAIGEYRTAQNLLAELCSQNCEDSAVWFLYGILLMESNRYEQAAHALEQALILNPGYPLYQFRLAEARYRAGLDSTESINTAIELNPGNGWVYLLAAQASLSSADFSRAEALVNTARSLLPEEADPLILQARILAAMNRLQTSLSVFDPDDPSAAPAARLNRQQVLHALAGILAETEEYETAELWYQRACRTAPHDPDLLADRAENCIALDMLSEADDLLSRSLDLKPAPGIYSLIAMVSLRRGEAARAEIALRQGLNEFPNDAVLLYDLGTLYLNTHKEEKARQTVQQLHNHGMHDLADQLNSAIEDLTTETLTCCTCAREWRIPRSIPPQGLLRLTDQPPDELPAGTCPDCTVHYCIGCAKAHLDDDGRFRCAHCGKPLKLIHQGLIWLLNRWLEEKEA